MRATVVPIADARTHTVRVRLDLPAVDGLLPGQYARARFPIGLVPALGASRGQVLGLLLAESATLALLGGLLGVAFGLGIGVVLRLAFPGLPVETPLRFVLAGLGTSVLTGLLAGVLPARRAAGLDPDRGPARRIAASDS